MINNKLDDITKKRLINNENNINYNNNIIESNNNNLIYNNDSNNNIIKQNNNYNNFNKIINKEENKEKINDNPININDINNLTFKDDLFNNLGNDYIDSNQKSLSKEIQKNIMTKLNYINNTEGLNLRNKFVFINDKKVENNNNNSQPLNNINEKKDLDIKINNINYQQNQISNSNIIVNVSYGKDNSSTQIETSMDKKGEMPELKPKPKNKINPEKKIKRHIEIKEDLNLYFQYKIESSFDDVYLVSNNEKFENFEEKKSNMNLNDYIQKLKVNITPNPCIKPFDEKSIKMNEKYVLAEDLREEEIIPDLYEEDEEDIKSLGQSLEKSIDKIFPHSYNENMNESLNDNSNNAGRNIINQLQNMIVEDINEYKDEEDGNDIKDNYTYEEEDELNESNENN